MKTAQQYYEEALETHSYAVENSDGHIDLEYFMVSAMQQYAQECFNANKDRLFESCDEIVYYTDHGKSAGFLPDQSDAMCEVFENFIITTP